MRADPRIVEDNVQRALDEDAAFEDVTAAFVPDVAAVATITCNTDAVFCGRAWAAASFALLDASVRIDWQADDGAIIAPGTVVAQIEGPSRALLSAERTALNFLQLLSGVATATKGYIARLGASDCVLLDTRKTLPGLRHAQKYAVATGGAMPHRGTLAEMILVKENHWALLRDPEQVLAEMRSRRTGKTIIAEVEDPAQLPAMVAADPDVVLLDNMTPEQIREAVEAYPDVVFEASGGITPCTIGAIAGTGVARISCGALTKDVSAIDFSMRVAKA